MLAQVQAACEVPWLSEVILDFLEVHGLKEAVGLVKQAGKRCVVCTPRSAPVLALSPDFKTLPQFLHICPADLYSSSCPRQKEMTALHRDVRPPCEMSSKHFGAIPLVEGASKLICLPWSLTALL